MLRQRRPDKEGGEELEVFIGELIRETPLRKLHPFFLFFFSGGGRFLTLARMVWGTYAVKIEVQMAFAQVGPEIKCPRVPV